MKERHTFRGYSVKTGVNSVRRARAQAAALIGIGGDKMSLVLTPFFIRFAFDFHTSIANR